ncbi:MAG: hypothetical protein HC886_05245 [Leptolyngbyaceae cyanobacterium SM1_1_3]|nr:hypothetical protein [Leptolyngbyaceae cyanobacterium SM1_1_3]NJO09998.1 hypothetical protein [Leptolyngbyaceae cyanobacterium SL_1_1]
MIQTRNFAPVFLSIWIAVCLLVVGTRYQLSRVVTSDASDYVIKPVVQNVVYYVEPRFSKHMHLERGQYFKELAAEKLLASLEEISQSNAIASIQPHLRKVDGQDVPGLFVFIDQTQIAQQPAPQMQAGAAPSNTPASKKV